MSQQPRRILIVDDEPSVRHALGRGLRNEGYELFCAAEPFVGLALMKARHFDMVISDHLMPNMTGLEFLKIVRNRQPDAVRIMLTGQADRQTAIDAINHGCIRNFLTKPWDETELKVTLSLAFEQLAVERENRKLLAMVRRQYDAMKLLELEHPGIAHLVRDAEGNLLLDEERAGLLEVKLQLAS
jgi:DNA-binding NtrC family response regulator